MGLGLVGAAGADALRQSIRQRLIDKQMAERQGQEMDLAERRMALAEQDAGLRTSEREQDREDKRVMLTRLQHQDDVALEDRKMAQARTLDESTPAGFIADTPETKQITGRLQMVGALTPQMGRAPVDEGPLMPGDTGAARDDGFMKRSTPLQANTLADNERAAAQQASLAADRTADNARQEAANRQAADDRAAMRGVVGSNRGLQDQIAQQRLDDMKAKSAEAAKVTADKETHAKQSTAEALSLLDRLEQHPGLNRSTGIIDSLTSGFSQEATDANGLRDQLVATLTLPNLGSLKGPMSDKDVVFVKQLATRLGNPKLSDTETRKAIAEARTVLQGRDGSATAPAGAPKSGDTKTFPNGAKAVFDGQGWVKQ